MSSYQNMINSVCNIICDGVQKKNNYILVGENSSGKSDILRSVIQSKIGQAVYFIDSVNRTYDAEKVELESRAYENVNLTPDCVISERIAPNNFNLQDTFKAMSCIEQLFCRYEQRLIRMCKAFLKIDIRIERENMEAGLTENKVLVNEEEIKLSSGYQAVFRVFSEILYFCDVIKGQAWRNGVVLIDELDEYLSPNYSSQIFNFLLQEFPDISFVVSTHSIDLVKSAEHANLIILNSEDYTLYSSKELESSIAADDIFTELFFSDRIYHKSNDDMRDKELRRLLNLKIAGAWHEEERQQLEKLGNMNLLPHQKIIYRQIREW